MMKKRLLLLLTAFLLLLPAVYAKTDWVQDNAGLLSQSEEAALEARIDGIRDEYGVDVVIATVNGIPRRDVVRYAADYYDERGYAEDGLIFLLDMGERQYGTSTCGVAIRAFTDWGIDQIHAAITPKLSRGDYAGAFSAYLNDVERYMTYYRSNGYGIDIPGSTPSVPRTTAQLLKEYAPVIVLGSALLSLVIVLIMRGKCKSVRRKSNAADYISAFNLTESQDNYLRTTTVKRRIETQSSGGSGGSRGGSTTFRSSSGRSHGGRSGRF